MTVTSDTAQSGPYTPDGITYVFPFTFKALTPEEVLVYTTTDAGNTVLTSGYAVSFADQGGSVAFTTPPAIGSGLITLASNPDFTQGVNLSNQGPFLPGVLNEAFDRSAIRDILLRNRLTATLAVFGIDQSALVNSTTAQLRAVAALYFKGDPGGNAMAVGLMSAANLLNIPAGTDLVQTSGYTKVGVGAARYAATSNTGTTTYRFQSANGRWFELAEAVPSVMMFGAVGDATTDDAPAWNAATAYMAARGGGDLYAPQAVYLFNSAVSVGSNVRLNLGGSAIQAKSGSTATQLFTASNAPKAQICNGVLDGTNLAAPTGAYSFGPSPGTGIYITAPSNAAVKGIRVADVVFQNFQAGGVLVGSTAGATNILYDLIVERCEFNNMQIYTGAETPGVVHFQNSTACLQSNCSLSGYNWKGFYTGNGAFNVISNCYANGGTTGNSSHYITGGNDNSIVNCAHTGAGFGVKCFNTVRPVVDSFHSLNSYAGLLLEGAQDFKVTDLDVQDPVIQAIGIYGNTGLITNGVLTNPTCKLTVAGTTVNNTAVTLQAFSGGAINGIDIINPDFDNFYHGVQSQNTAVAAQINIRLRGGSITNNANYGILLWAQDVVIDEVEISQTGASPCVFVGNIAGVSGADIKIAGNTFTGSSVQAIQLATGGGVMNYDTVAIVGNKVKGGSALADIQVNNSTTDFINHLIITDNRGDGLTANGVTATFNTTTSLVLRCFNTLLDASFVPVNDSFTNPGNVTIEGVFAGTGSPQGVWNAIKGRAQYWQTDGTDAASLTFVPETTGKTGWVAK